MHEHTLFLFRVLAGRLFKTWIVNRVALFVVRPLMGYYAEWPVYSLWRGTQTQRGPARPPLSLSSHITSPGPVGEKSQIYGFI